MGCGRCRGISAMDQLLRVVRVFIAGVYMGCDWRFVQGDERTGWELVVSWRRNAVGFRWQPRETA